MAIYSTLKRKVQSGARRIRTYLKGKVAKPHKTPKAAERETTIATCSYGQDDLSICSDSSSLWNVTPMSFRDVFELSLESDQDAWTVDTVALDAILRDINGEEEDPDCPPRLRFRRCSSPELKSKGRPSTTAAKASPVRETEESSSVNSPKRCRKRHTAYLPPSEIILVKEADADSRIDFTVEKAMPSLPPVRPKHSRRRQNGPLRLAKLPSITDSRPLQWSADSEFDVGISRSTCSILIAYQDEAEN